MRSRTPPVVELQVTGRVLVSPELATRLKVELHQSTARLWEMIGCGDNMRLKVESRLTSNEELEQEERAG